MQAMVKVASCLFTCNIIKEGLDGYLYFQAPVMGPVGRAVDEFAISELRKLLQVTFTYERQLFALLVGF